jgi:hypothetical protein
MSSKIFKIIERLTNFPVGLAMSNDGLGKGASGALTLRASDVKNIQLVQVMGLYSV